MKEMLRDAAQAHIRNIPDAKVLLQKIHKSVMNVTPICHVVGTIVRVPGHRKVVRGDCVKLRVVESGVIYVEL